MFRAAGTICWNGPEADCCRSEVKAIRHHTILQPQPGPGSQSSASAARASLPGLRGWFRDFCRLPFLVCLLLSPSFGQTPFFREVAAETGLQFHHFTGATGEFYMPEIMGSGVALFDYDRDGDLDLLVNGIAAGTRLFWNDGSGRWREAKDSGLSRTASATSLALPRTPMSRLIFATNASSP